MYLRSAGSWNILSIIILSLSLADFWVELKMIIVHISLNHKLN